MGIRDRSISLGWPWRKGIVERLIGTLRHECLDQVAIFGEGQLRRVHCSYAAYCNRTHSHLALHKDAPLRRAVQQIGGVVAILVLGKLHHQYVRISFSEWTVATPQILQASGGTRAICSAWERDIVFDECVDRKIGPNYCRFTPDLSLAPTSSSSPGLLLEIPDFAVVLWGILRPRSTRDGHVVAWHWGVDHTRLLPGLRGLAGRVTA
jgi:hypothetical protein